MKSCRLTRVSSCVRAGSEWQHDEDFEVSTKDKHKTVGKEEFGINRIWAKGDVRRQGGGDEKGYGAFQIRATTARKPNISEDCPLRLSLRDE